MAVKGSGKERSGKEGSGMEERSGSGGEEE